MATIGIVGWGVVGQATGNAFAAVKSNKVLWWDKYKKSPVTLQKLVKDSEFIFICVPTPMKDNYSNIDLSIVKQVVSRIAKLIDDRKKILTIKSTVIPGTTASLAKQYPHVNFAMNPEFLTEANAFEDFLRTDRTVIGAFKHSVADRLSILYQNLYGPGSKIFLTDPTTAEMVKYMSNMFLATKVMFANEMSDLCQKVGINYQEVKEMVVADHRIFDSHLDVTSIKGFGGKCFPKDMVALLGLFKQKKVDASLLSTVWKKNLRVRQVRDWEEIAGAVSSKKHKKIRSSG